MRTFFIFTFLWLCGGASVSFAQSASASVPSNELSRTRVLKQLYQGSVEGELVRWHPKPPDRPANARNASGFAVTFIRHVLPYYDVVAAHVRTVIVLEDAVEEYPNYAMQPDTAQHLPLAALVTQGRNPLTSLDIAVFELDTLKSGVTEWQLRKFRKNVISVWANNANSDDVCSLNTLPNGQQLLRLDETYHTDTTGALVHTRFLTDTAMIQQSPPQGEAQQVLVLCTLTPSIKVVLAEPVAWKNKTYPDLTCQTDITFRAERYRRAASATTAHLRGAYLRK